MANKTLDLLHVRTMSFKTNLAKNDSKTRNYHVTKHLADNFNSLLEDVKKQLSTDDAGHLPPRIPFVSDASRVAGMSDVLYVDLEIMVDQVAGILERLKAEG